MLLAHKAYSAVVEAVASEPEAGAPDPQELPRLLFYLGQEQGMPDFERLNDTTDATIRGMWCGLAHPDPLMSKSDSALGTEQSTYSATPASTPWPRVLRHARTQSSGSR